MPALHPVPSSTEARPLVPFARSLLGLLVLVLLLPPSLQADSFRLLAKGPDYVDLEYILPRLELKQSASGDWIAGIEGACLSLEKDAPEIPVEATSLIVPAGGFHSVEVLEQVEERIADRPLRPSPGNLKRDGAPVIRTKGQAYSDKLWPAEPAELGAVYTFRDHRGQALRLFPVRQAEGRDLLVTRRMVLRLRADAPFPDPPATVDAAFDRVYQEHFLNYTAPSPEDLQSESMLVIAPPAYHQQLGVFSYWKNRLGIQVELVSTDSLVMEAEALQAFIYSQWQQKDFTALLLVGEYIQIPPVYISDEDYGDQTYALLEGEDVYPEILLGRMPAGTVEHLGTMIERTLLYESCFGEDEWVGRAMGIASEEGVGDDGEYDWEHMDNIRLDLLAGDYEQVDQLYPQNDVNYTQILDLWNQGRGLVNYTGHGNHWRWATGSLTHNRVYTLDNFGKWPVVLSVACNTASFDVSTCLAEAMIRSRDSNGMAIGAVSVVASTIFISWSPPMELQDTFNALLAPADGERSVGVLLTASAASMVEGYSWSGSYEARFFQVIGDPMLRVRTRPAVDLQIDAPAVIVEGQTGIDLGNPNATSVTYSLLADNELVAVQQVQPNAEAVLRLPEDLNSGQDLLLSAVGDNRRPWQGSLEVVPDWSPELRIFVFGPTAYLYWSTHEEAAGYRISHRPLDSAEWEVLAESTQEIVYAIDTNAGSGSYRVQAIFN